MGALIGGKYSGERGVVEYLAKQMNAGTLARVVLEASHVISCEILKEVMVDILWLDHDSLRG